MSLRWLALLFDIPFDGDMPAAEWSRMLRCVSSRLAADAEGGVLDSIPLGSFESIGSVLVA